ncbi:hypothetical protein HBI68_001180 [Parastagonospora nodorum]|nr:hypothetical protein HBI68_001180 [Parastagonospora nodorum]
MFTSPLAKCMPCPVARMDSSLVSNLRDSLRSFTYYSDLHLGLRPLSPSLSAYSRSLAALGKSSTSG